MSVIWIPVGLPRSRSRHGLGYLRSLSDLETFPVASKNGTPVLIRDLGTVSFGPDIRRGVAEWNGEGEAVGGIVVMRYGLNALNVISGVKKKLAEISGSKPRSTPSSAT
jgi:copper/silver efflux system protein